MVIRKQGTLSAKGIEEAEQCPGVLTARTVPAAGETEETGASEEATAVPVMERSSQAESTDTLNTCVRRRGK